MTGNKFHTLSALLFLCAIALASAFCSGCRSVSKEDLPRLTKELSHKDARIRNQAALDIARLGKDGKPAVPALIRLLDDNNGGVRSAAAYALDSIATPEALAAIQKYKKEHPLGGDAQERGSSASS